MTEPVPIDTSPGAAGNDSTASLSTPQPESASRTAAEENSVVRSSGLTVIEATPTAGRAGKVRPARIPQRAQRRPTPSLIEVIASLSRVVTSGLIR
jgi:hypothetical protein